MKMGRIREMSNAVLGDAAWEGGMLAAWGEGRSLENKKKKSWKEGSVHSLGFLPCPALPVCPACLGTVLYYVQEKR